MLSLAVLIADAAVLPVLAQAAPVPRGDGPPTQAELDRLVAKLQSRDKWGIFKEPVTEEMVRCAPCVTVCLPWNALEICII